MPVEAGRLAGVPLFADLAPATLAAVAEAASERRHRRGAFLFVEGDPSAAFHFVLSGRVRVFRDTPDGHEQTLHLADRGTLLAMICFVEGRPYPASAQAVTDSDVGSIRNADLANLVKTHGDLGWRLLVQFSRRLLWAQSRIYDAALRSAGGRVANALLRLGHEHGQPGADGTVTVDIPLTHRELGDLIGVSRETVTRTLRQLRDAGAVHWTPDGLLVLHPDTLEAWPPA